MPPRSDLATHLADLVGAETLVIRDAATGWPSRGSLNLDGAWVEVDIFVGPIGLSQRNRDDVERRFQNPGKDRPIVLTPGRMPLLIGVWEQDPLIPVPRPVIVLAEVKGRIGRATRQSIFQWLSTLKEAVVTGWETRRSESGEVMHYLFPPLLPLAVAARADTLLSPEQIVPDQVVQAVVLGSGLAEGDGQDIAAAQRARRASSAIVRDAWFSRRVIEAYGGRCAMCGLDVGLVQGAHIYPAAAPGSPDETWNGLALCPTHHVAFDRHLIAVRAADASIQFRDTLTSQRASSRAVQNLIDSTFHQLATPHDANLKPRKDMFERRYAHFDRQYDWLTTA